MKIFKKCAMHNKDSDSVKQEGEGLTLDEKIIIDHFQEQLQDLQKKHSDLIEEIEDFIRMELSGDVALMIKETLTKYKQESNT